MPTFIIKTSAKVIIFNYKSSVAGIEFFRG